MSNLPIDPNIMPLINGVKPYLGLKAQNYADMFASVIKLLTSNSGQEVITTMGRILAPDTADSVSIETNKGLGALMVGPNIAFSLFLILILLIFATGGLGWMGGFDAADEVSTDNPGSDPAGATEV